MIVVLRMFRVTSESQDHGTFSHMKWDNEAVCRFDGDDGSTYTFQKSTMNVDGDKLQVIRGGTSVSEYTMRSEIPVTCHKIHMIVVRTGGRMVNGVPIG